MLAVPGAFKKGGGTRKGYSHLLASALSLRAGGSATILSRKCDILSLLKDDQIVHDNRLPVHCRHVASRGHRTAISVVMQTSLPLVCLPPVLKVPQKKSSVEKRAANYRDPKPRNPKLLEKNSKITPRTLT